MNAAIKSVLSLCYEPRFGCLYSQKDFSCLGIRFYEGKKNSYGNMFFMMRTNLEKLTSLLLNPQIRNFGLIKNTHHSDNRISHQILVG